MNELHLPRKIATLQRVTNKSHIVGNIILYPCKPSYVATDAILFLYTANFLIFLFAKPNFELFGIFMLASLAS